MSGAQTGVDQGGLLAAIDLGFEWGGWVPRGWRTEKGTVLSQASNRRGRGRRQEEIMEALARFPIAADPTER